MGRSRASAGSDADSCESDAQGSQSGGESDDSLIFESDDSLGVESSDQESASGGDQAPSSGDGAGADPEASQSSGERDSEMSDTDAGSTSSSSCPATSARAGRLKKTTRGTPSSSRPAESARAELLDEATLCPELAKETWAEHLRAHGPRHQCPRCRFMRQRQQYEAALTYDCGGGETGAWIEQVCTAEHAWGLGCKVCRWAQMDTAFARGEIRGERATRLSALRRHGNMGRCHAHAKALEKVRRQTEEASCTKAEEQPPEAGPRDDVPSIPLFYAAYKVAKKGQSFQSYEDDVVTMRAGGAPLKNSRGSRFVAKNMIECTAAELSWEDSMLLRRCSDVALTMDERKGMLVVRVRLTMGSGMPKGFRAEALGGESPAVAPGATDREIAGTYGKYIHTVDRLLSFRGAKAFDDTPALAQHLTDALKEACGSDDVWQRVRRRVRACCPDGAPNEQLAARLASETFDEMRFVVRCGAHAIQGAVKTAWTADGEAAEVTRVMTEVGKFLRSSSRFALRFGSKAQEEAVAAVLNFNFAPQRFCSKERPLTRAVHFARSVMLALGIEVTAPTSPERRQWALDLVRKMNGPFWTLVGMLADLSEDCAVFLRKFDEKYLDPIKFQAHLARFLEQLSTEYERGGMWLRTASTYSAKIVEMLEATSTLSFADGYVVVSRPTKEEARQCIAKVANVAAALRAALNAEFPNFSVQRHFSAFELRGVTPTASQAEGLQKIVDLLGWPQAERRACVLEFPDAFGKAYKEKQAKKKQGHDLSDRDAWAKVVAVDKSKATLKRVVCMILGFLLTETECERNFAEERRAYEGRPRLQVETRFHGLKVMLDGLPFDRLQQAGEPVGDFWRKCQDRYADKFGTRRLGDRATRKDKSTTRATGGKVGGKRTVAGFKRERAEALHAQAIIPFGPAPEARPRTVFGHREMKRQKLEDLRKQEETAKYREMIAKMEAKLEKKREEYDGVLSGRRKSLAQVTPAKRREVMRKSAALRRAICAIGFSGFRAVHRGQIFRAMGGNPLVFLQEGATDNLSGRGLDEEMVGGRPLRDYIWADDLRDYVASARDARRRLILVRSLACVPDDLRLAAAFLGARVQEQLRVPALHFAALVRHTFACTAHFRRQHADVVAVIRGAAARAAVPGTARVALRSVCQFSVAYDAMPEKSKGRQRLFWTLLYEDIQDVEVANLSLEVKQVARSLPEFMRACVKMQRPLAV